MLLLLLLLRIWLQEDARGSADSETVRLELRSSYYANWSGLGVEYKTSDATPRVIFWSRYLDWVVTGPVSLLFWSEKLLPLACDAERCATRDGADPCQIKGSPAEKTSENGIRSHSF